METLFDSNAPKKPTNLSLNSDLLEKSRKLKINLSATLEEALKHKLAESDVYLNPSNKTRKVFPYILDIQNSQISDIATRIVIPLGNLEYFKNEKMDRLTPQIEYEDKQLLLLVPQIASMCIFW